MRPLKKIVNEYEWFHTWLGVTGNVLFVIGSVLFLSESTKHLGTWLFIVGSSLMFVGSTGSALVRLYDESARGSDEVARQTTYPVQVEDERELANA